MRNNKKIGMILCTLAFLLICISIFMNVGKRTMASANHLDFEFTSAESAEGFTAAAGNVSWQAGELIYRITGAGSNLTTCEINAPKGTRYSALLSVRNTIRIHLKNDTGASRVRLSFITSNDRTYNNQKSKVFEIQPNSDYTTYYFNLSDLRYCTNYLKGFRLEPMDAEDGEIRIKSISFEREFKIQSTESEGSVDSCTADGSVITIRGSVPERNNGKTIAVYESPVTNYTQSLAGLTKLAEAAAADGHFTIEIPYMNENVTRLSTLFLAAVENTPLGPWFRVENYQDFTDNPYAFTLKNMEVSVTEARFGAKGDAYTNDNEAIQKAIDYVSQQGGGRVIIPGDPSNPYGRRYIVTNIKMKSNVELHIEEGAVLWQSSRVSDYAYSVALGHDVNIPGVNWAHAASCHNMPLIQGDRVSNVKITGKGILRSSDQGGENVDGLSGDSLRVNCDQTIHLVPIGFYRCSNVEIRDVQLKRTNNYHINMRTCTNVYIANVFMDEVGCVSGDGISATVGTKNMVIDRCFLYSNDDAVTICSTYNDPRGLAWWFADPEGDNCIDHLVVRHCNLYGGHGITFITWGTDNPDLSMQEIKNITVYDNVLNGSACSVGSWGDNPYYGRPFDGSETDDYSPVKNVRIYDNIYMKAADVSPVLCTDIITDCGICSAKDFLYGDFERPNGETGWTAGLSNCQYDQGNASQAPVAGTTVGTVEKGSVEKGQTGYAGYLKTPGRLYQGLYMIEGAHTFTADVYLEKKGSARLFAVDSLTGALLAETKISASKQFKTVRLSFTCQERTNCYIGIELLSEGAVYIDNCTVSSQEMKYPQYFLVDFDENHFDCFEYARWNKVTENENTYISLPSYLGGIFKLQPDYTYSDCEISFSVMLNSVNSTRDANFGFSLRRNNGGNDQYDIHYNPISRVLNIRRFEGGNPKVLFSEPYTMESGCWYQVKVIIEGGKLELYIDDVLTASVLDADPLPEGEAFICTFNNSIACDNVKFARIGGGIDEDPRKNIKIDGMDVHKGAGTKTPLPLYIAGGILAALAAGGVLYIAVTGKKYKK